MDLKGVNKFLSTFIIMLNCQKVSTEAGRTEVWEDISIEGWEDRSIGGLEGMGAYSTLLLAPVEGLVGLWPLGGPFTPSRCPPHLSGPLPRISPQDNPLDI